VYLIAPKNIGLYHAILHIVVDYYSLSQYLLQLLNCNQNNGVVSLYSWPIRAFPSFYNLPSVLLKTTLTWSFETSNIASVSTYFAKYGSHNFMMFMGSALINLLQLGLWFFHVYPSLHSLEHFIQPSPWAPSSSARNCWFYYKVLLHHVKIHRWI
jgi:hypothetical protein